MNAFPFPEMRFFVLGGETEVLLYVILGIIVAVAEVFSIHRVCGCRNAMHGFVLFKLAKRMRTFCAEGEKMLYNIFSLKKIASFVG